MGYMCDCGEVPYDRAAEYGPDEFYVANLYTTYISERYMSG